MGDHPSGFLGGVGGKIPKKRDEGVKEESAITDCGTITKEKCG